MTDCPVFSNKISFLSVLGFFDQASFHKQSHQVKSGTNAKRLVVVDIEINQAPVLGMCLSKMIHNNLM